MSENLPSEQPKKRVPRKKPHMTTVNRGGRPRKGSAADLAKNYADAHSIEALEFYVSVMRDEVQSGGARPKRIPVPMDMRLNAATLLLTRSIGLPTRPSEDKGNINVLITDAAESAYNKFARIIAAGGEDEEAGVIEAAADSGGVGGARD